MVYLITYGFEGLGQGWSETHACKSATESPSALQAIALNVAQKRVTFLGREFRINFIRISKYSDDGATVRLKGVSPRRVDLRNPIVTAAQAAEPAVVALNVVGTTGAGLAPAAYVNNINRTYCGAPPDLAVDNGGIVDPGKAGLAANFGQWAAACLQANFGWLINDTIANLDINTISSNANGTVTITTAPVTTEPLVIGKSYPARARRVNMGRSPLNGQLILKYTAANTFVTQEVIGLALAQEGGAVRIYRDIYPYAGFLNLDLQLQTAKHQRGRPFGSTPGRQRNRIRG